MSASPIGIAPSSSERRDAREFVTRARGLRELIEREADNGEKSGTMPPSVVEALRQAELFWVLCPREVGGAAESVLTYMAMLEEVSSFDASTGWTLMANSTATLVAATLCTDEHLARMFGGPTRPVMALTFAPSGRCTPTESGFKGTGRYGFGSGINHADWVSGGMIVHENGKPKMLPNGMPQVVGAFLPKGQIRLLGNWDVVGLQGTGSYDFEIPEQVIPADHTYDQYFTSPRRGGAVAALGVPTTAAAGHVSVVLGMARRALHEIARIASQRKRLGSSEMIASNALFRSEFMKHAALYDAARALVFDRYGVAEAAARAGQPVTKLMQSRMRQAVTWGHIAARDVVQFCYGAGASGSLRNPSVLGRLLRDVSVAAQHIIVDPMSMVEHAPEVIAFWAEPST
jgi:alkylation response protein AidB-like acyl-CoA dehydrogenase